MSHIVEWYLMNKKERAALVRFYLSEKGWSYSQLAQRLGVTRNVIAGICNRNGIKIGTKQNLVVLPSTVDNVVPFPLPPSPPAPRREEAVLDMAKKLKAKRKASVQSNAIQRMQGRIEDAASGYVRDPRPLREEVWRPLPGSLPIILEDTNAQHCRWPVSEDNKMCCGNRAIEGKVYCEHHNALAYRPAPPLKVKIRRGQKTLAA